MGVEQARGPSVKRVRSTDSDNQEETSFRSRFDATKVGEARSRRYTQETTILPTKCYDCACDEAARKGKPWPFMELLRQAQGNNLFGKRPHGWMHVKEVREGETRPEWRAHTVITVLPDCAALLILSYITCHDGASEVHPFPSAEQGYEALQHRAEQQDQYPDRAGQQQRR